MKQYLLLMVCVSLSTACDTRIKGNAARTQDTLEALLQNNMVSSALVTEFRNPTEDSIKALLEFITSTDNHRYMVSKKYSEKPLEYFPEMEVVIQTPHRKYTLYFNHQMSELSLWMRPRGTVSRAVLTNIVDMYTNGTVDFAVESNTAPKLLFSSEAMFGEDKRGEKHEAYWQKRYKNAVDSLIAYLNVPM
jgi:hypothetical protein